MNDADGACTAKKVEEARRLHGDAVRAYERVYATLGAE